MLIPTLITILSLLLPVLILRPFSRPQKTLALIIVVTHLSLMFYMHYKLLRETGATIVYDAHTDAQRYYEGTLLFKEWAPFSITVQEAIDAAGGSKHFGYEYLLGTLHTITPNPMLAMRLLKVLLFFTSLSCLARAWLKDYGRKYAYYGFLVLGVVFTPIIYYNYRNLKDSVILSLFMFTMALLNTILRPIESDTYRAKPTKKLSAWALLLVLLLIITTFRTYTAAIIVIAIGLHSFSKSNISMKSRAGILLALAAIFIAALRTGAVTAIFELGGEKLTYQNILAAFSLRGILQAFLSPLPWGQIRVMEPLSTPFYWIYWLVLPYALYSMIRHIRTNLNWQIFVYFIILYVVGVAIGDPPRKRLIVYPILLGWVLAHLAYKQWCRARVFEYENELYLQQGIMYEYTEDQAQTI